MMPQPPYSPNLAPCDFFLFPKLKRPMKGRRYATLDEIKTASKEELKKIFKNDFFEVLRRLEKPLAQRLTPEFHRRVKAKTSFQDDDVPIDDTTTKPLFTPQEKGHKGKKASESFHTLRQAFKEDALSQSRKFEWFSRFKTGRTSVKDDLHTGRSLSIRNPENALEIKSSIKENIRITIRELSEDLDISFGTCQTIIKNDLYIKRSPAKFIPHLLTNEQKEHRNEMCKIMVEMFNSDPHWLKNVITGYDPETKRQSRQWLEPGEPRF
ncbi:hypothetical protein LAZ67_1006667 [Cordylochernes scorpioides]|uniref:Mos1 transposase HTH domain-containing protein n=1 Tax=Cordylochernes scorpioides TaxID=51811 RepID=A0ABY6K2B8_9ARAC|nr:hypothetical protein LAZ67_1006667 [Cordylochernes scorpioides]